MIRRQTEQPLVDSEKIMPCFCILGLGFLYYILFMKIAQCLSDKHVGVKVALH